MKNKPRFKQEFLLIGIPADNEVSYALIYQQETLPATGSSTSALTALGLLAVGSLVLLVHNMTGTVFCSL
ncbi:TPA: LPXTG cell wall anchor domain-containing protein [Streptococcus pneumoniae]